MNFYIVSSFINGLVAIVFGWFIFSKNWKNITNITFLLMSASVAFWSFSYSEWLLMTTPDGALFWSRMLNLGATFIPIFYLHWVLSILDLVKLKKNILILGYGLTIFFAYFSFSPLYIKSVSEVYSFLFWPQAGFLYILFLIFCYFSLTIYGFYQLIKARRLAKGEKMHQINYVILGSLFGFGGGATNFPLMFGVGLFPPIGQPLVVLYIIIFGLATLRYHLFEMKIILVELLTIIMCVALAILLFFMPTPALKLLVAVILVFFLIFGYLFVKTIHREIADKEEAERISKLKTEFISIVSHQLRTPLAAIRGYAGMLKDGDYGPLPENTKTPIGYIHDSSVSMIKMVNGLLSITRLERGKVELKIQDVSIDELVEECISDVELTAKEKGLYLKYTKPKKVITIKGDPEKIKQAIINIINNALLYTPKGGVTVKVSLFGEFVNISIKDTGIGIDEEDLGKIFQSFARGKRGVELYTQGTGLGLYVAKSFIEMHNGKINVSSKGINKGSTFEIILPVRTEIAKKQEFNLFPNPKET